MEDQVFDLFWLASVVGFFLPLLISFVKRNEWSTKAKQVVALVASALSGIIIVGAEAGWSLDDPVALLQLAIFSVVDVYVVASVTYNNFFDGTQVEASLANVGSDEYKAATA